MAAVNTILLANVLKLIWNGVDLPHFSDDGSFRYVLLRQHGKTTLTPEFGQIPLFNQNCRLTKIGQQDKNLQTSDCTEYYDLAKSTINLKLTKPRTNKKTCDLTKNVID